MTEIIGNTPHYQLQASGHRGSKAVRRLVEYAPASGALALWMRHRDVTQADGLPASIFQLQAGAVRQQRKTPPIANDGQTLYYTSHFEAYALEEQCALVAHQVLHIALRHAARFNELQSTHGKVDIELFTLCADALINASLSHLEWMKLPKGSIELSQLLQHVLSIEEPSDTSLLRWDTESLYRAIDDRDSTNSTRQAKQSKRSGQSEQSRAMAADMLPDLLPAAEQKPEQQAEQVRLWSERLTRAHAADGEQSLIRQLLADRPKVRTPWQFLLRTRMNRSLSAQIALSWSRPTRSWIACQGKTRSGRKLPWQPGITAFREAPKLCVIADVSGSIDDELVRRFTSEIDRLLRIQRCAVKLIVGDDQVRHSAMLKPGCEELSNIEFHGGGGTDFRPLVKAAAQWSPDLLIVLTDLDGPAGKPPSFPVIWAVTPQVMDIPAPYGIRIQLEL